MPWWGTGEMLFRIETDLIWSRILLITTPHWETDPKHARKLAPLCVTVCLSVQADELSAKKDFKIPEDSCPLERKKEGCLVGLRGGSVEGLESVKPLAVFSLLKKIHCPRWCCLQQYAYISSAVIDANTPHTNHHLCYIVGLHQNKIMYSYVYYLGR